MFPGRGADSRPRLLRCQARYRAAGGGPARSVGSTIALPSVGAEACPTSDGVVAADSGAMQSYVYQGPKDSLFDLRLSADGNVSAALSDQSVLLANAAVILAPSLDRDLDPAIFIGENAALEPNASLVAEACIDFSAAPGLFNLGQQTRMSFSLDNGDEVFRPGESAGARRPWDLFGRLQFPGTGLHE